MELLRRIAEAKGPCVTVTAPTGQPAVIEEALRSVESSLPESDRKPLLDPLRDKIKNRNDVETGTMILLSSADVKEAWITAEQLPTAHTVGDSFPLRAILPAIQQAHEFYLLALSQNRTRLLHCTESSSEEVHLPKAAPASLQESRGSDKPESTLDMGSAGPSQGGMKGVMSGTGTEGEHKPEYMHNFFTTINRAVHAIADHSDLPLILVGVESELAIYRKVNTYPLLGETAVLGSPDAFKGGEMHARGLRALTTYVSPAVKKTLDDLDRLVGTGHASVHIAEVVKAAHEGRVSQLFLQHHAEYLGHFDEMRGKTTHHAAPGEEREDLVEDAVRQTVLHGGNVRLLTGKQMPNGVPLCAVFRY